MIHGPIQTGDMCHVRATAQPIAQPDPPKLRKGKSNPASSFLFPPPKPWNQQKVNPIPLPVRSPFINPLALASCVIDTKKECRLIRHNECRLRQRVRQSLKPQTYGKTNSGRRKSRLRINGLQGHGCLFIHPIHSVSRDECWSRLFYSRMKRQLILRRGEFG